MDRILLGALSEKIGIFDISHGFPIVPKTADFQMVLADRQKAMAQQMKSSMD